MAQVKKNYVYLNPLKLFLVKETETVKDTPENNYKTSTGPNNKAFLPPLTPPHPLRHLYHTVSEC